ncbi:MAG: AAA-like domain-containing protein [Chloroflexota bacterium]
MRRFSSYGPIDTELQYYVPRQALIQSGCSYLLGDDPQKGGNYITVWAPRQSGKTWIMQQVRLRLSQNDAFEVGIINLQSARNADTEAEVLDILVARLASWFQRDFPDVDSWQHLSKLFTTDYFSKPIILIIDEFDALGEDFIRSCVTEFRSMYISRQNEPERLTGEKGSLLHGLALIGVRSVLGVDNQSGSPFNIQRSLYIPNLTHEEVSQMFRWYERESSQSIAQDVIDTIFFETRGQPGLVGWFGELLTETYNHDREQPITLENLGTVLRWAADGLGNNNIANIISKADQEPYRHFVLNLFQTDTKTDFKFDNPLVNFLYLNGIIDIDDSGQALSARFSSPFVQKRLFNRYADQLFGQESRLYDPFDDLADVVTAQRLDIKNLMGRYERYIQQNRERLFAGAPRRKTDLRIYEAVYHFHLFTYLDRFFEPFSCKVWPEFPTGNGKIDLFIDFDGTVYGLEVKSFATRWDYQQALIQAAEYGSQMKLTHISLIYFIEEIDNANRQEFEAAYVDPATGVTVTPIFVTIG